MALYNTTALHNTTALTTTPYGWKMKCVRKTAQCTPLGNNTGKDILKQLQTHNQFWCNSASITTSWYSKLTEWTGQDYRRRLWSFNRRAKQTQGNRWMDCCTVRVGRDRDWPTESSSCKASRWWWRSWYQELKRWFHDADKQSLPTSLFDLRLLNACDKTPHQTDTSKLHSRPTLTVNTQLQFILSDRAEGSICVASSITSLAIHATD